LIFLSCTQSDAELDLLLFKDGKRIGVECKLTDSPKATRSMHRAIEMLKLDSLKVIYTGTKSYPLTENIEAIGIEDLL